MEPGPVPGPLPPEQAHRAPRGGGPAAGCRIHPWSLLWGDLEITADEILAWGDALQLPERIRSALQEQVGWQRNRFAGPVFEELPEDLKVASLSLRHCPGLAAIGSGFESESRLEILDCGLLTSLPEGIRALDDIHLRGCSSFSRLPSVFATGCLSLTDLPLLESVALPPTFTGILQVADCPSLSSIRAWSHQLERFSLVQCPVSSLPSGLAVGQRLEWTSLPITAIPAGLQVAGDCQLSDLWGCTSFGEGICIGGNLVMAGMPGLQRIPGDLSVGGQVFLEAGMAPRLLPRHLRDRVG